MNGDLFEPVAWTWGLSLLALTLAIHAIGAVVLAIVSLRIRVRIANRRLPAVVTVTKLLICLA